jgi:hypothetical protein
VCIVKWRYKCIFVHIDIDECTESSALCSQICDNTDGSYKCSCKSGFSLNTDGISCKSKYPEMKLYALFIDRDTE